MQSDSLMHGILTANQGGPISLHAQEHDEVEMNNREAPIGHCAILENEVKNAAATYSCSVEWR